MLAAYFCSTRDDIIPVPELQLGRALTVPHVLLYVLSNNDLSRSFSTADASGSTSQAANIQEALELDASVLLVDEDTCATNFMIRDVRMQVYAVAAS